jgi:hypothetical protein
VRHIWIKTIFLTSLYASINSHAVGFVEIREQKDSFRAVKKIALKQDEKLKIDVQKIGWNSCEASHTEVMVEVKCYVTQDKFINYSCWGDESIEVDLNGNNYLIGLKIICTNKR